MSTMLSLGKASFSILQRVHRMEFLLAYLELTFNGQFKINEYQMKLHLHQDLYANFVCFFSYIYQIYSENGTNVKPSVFHQYVFYMFLSFKRL